MENQKEKKTLDQIKERLKWEKENRYDIIVPTDQLKVSIDVGTNTIKMEVPQPDGKIKTHGITNFAHSQLAEKCGIDKRYYDRMKQLKPNLIPTNVNAWLPDKETRLIRVLGDNVRAVLGSKYRCIDNYDVLFAAENEFDKIKIEKNLPINILEASSTETRLYIKATSPSLSGKIQHFRGRTEPVEGGIIITNTEVGCGAFRVEAFINVLVCQNGLVRDKAVRRIHVTREQDIGFIDWSDETRQLEDMALWAKVRDLIQQTFTPAIFQKWLAEINEIASVELAKPMIAVDNIIKLYEIPKTHKDDILNQLMKESPTQWGLAMAITNVAQTLPNYDQQIEWEHIGAKILKLKPEVLTKELKVEE